MTPARTATAKSTKNESARDHAQVQWNTNPCGAVPSEEYDRAFFDQVETDRYRQQYWQKGFFDYKSFRGGRVLEIGVGLGTDLKQFARNGAGCFGADITDGHLELAARNFQLEGLPVSLERSDATRLPFEDNSFDSVYSFGVLHHIPDARNVLREIHRVLKPGGVFQVAVYHLFSIHTAYLFFYALMKGQLRRLGVSGVLATIEKGADGVRIKPYVKLYTKRGLRSLLKSEGLDPVKVGIRHVNFDDLPFLNVFRLLERDLGWYVCAQARKI
jgi:ubiquinone/menaquinone biosynthesis C-methylase UbiE